MTNVKMQRILDYCISCCKCRHFAWRVDACNHGKHLPWLAVKQSHQEASLQLTAWRKGRDIHVLSNPQGNHG
jgi:hypothetical protein